MVKAINSDSRRCRKGGKTKQQFGSQQNLTNGRPQALVLTDDAVRCIQISYQQLNKSDADAVA